MKREITIDVRRSDGDVARLQGDQAIAVAVDRPPNDTKLGDIEPGLVSLRCDDEMGLALCLGTILAAVAAVSPGAIPLATQLARIMDGSNPSLRRKLPKLSGGDDAEHADK